MPIIGVALIFAASLLLGLVGTAAAVELPHIDEPEVKSVLQDIKVVHLPAPEIGVGLHLVPSDIYGTGDAVMEDELKGATNGEANVLSLDRVTSLPADKPKVEQCMSAAFKGVAADYRKVLEQSIAAPEAPISWPTFESDISAGVSPCLSAEFPSASKFVIDGLSGYLARQAAVYAEHALHADSAAAVFSKWMEITAHAIYASNESPPSNAAQVTSPTSGPPSSNDSSFPWAPVIVGGLVAVFGLGFWQSKRSS